MKRFENFTLQWRITLLTALVLIISSISFTTFSMLNAQRTFVSLIEEYISITAIDNNGIAITKDNISVNDADKENQTSGVTAPFLQKVKNNFDITSIIFCFIIAVIGTVLVYFVSEKALKPIRKLNEQVSKIDEYNLSERLSEGISNDEVSSLTKSFNHTLDRLYEAFERQKRFSASAAHELKTPLSTMKAGIQVLSMDENTTIMEYKENAHLIETSVDRMTQVINDLLLLATAGEYYDEVMGEICLHEMFDTIFDEVTPLYKNSGVTYEINCKKEKFYGNTSLLYRAFYNLIDNAYKYNRKDGHICVSICETNENIKMDISDDGYGIESKHLSLIFEAFYRVDASRSRKTAGSGLGLSIVKAIIEKHRGTISVASENDQGTRFSVILPK